MLIARRIIRTGNIHVVFEDRPAVRLGDGRGPRAVVRVYSIAFLLRVIVSPDLAFGEGFMGDDWRLEEGDLGELIGHLLVDQQRVSESILPRLYEFVRARLLSPQRRNDPSKSRTNVAHHYDIGNDLYSAFLDAGMNYSCAFFEAPEQSLRAAQLNKLRTSIRRLDVRKGASVLDIGCGWGELTRTIARETGAERITGITLAQQQYDWARAHAPVELGNRLGYFLQDYRDHATTHAANYDRVISIGMFEHVGKRHLNEYFDTVSRVLKSGGTALIHSILRPIEGGTSPWIDRYIFPGGYIPLLGEMLDAAKRAGLATVAEPFIHESRHYATTLRHWCKRFNDAYPSLNRRHYDARFRRMWNFYLAGSEAAFDATGFYIAQVLFRKPVRRGNIPANGAARSGHRPPLESSPGFRHTRPA